MVGVCTEKMFDMPFGKRSFVQIYLGGCVFFLCYFVISVIFHLWLLYESYYAMGSDPPSSQTSTSDL